MQCMVKKAHRNSTMSSSLVDANGLEKVLVSCKGRVQ
jgi:hypothetical protein